MLVPLSRYHPIPSLLITHHTCELPLSFCPWLCSYPPSCSYWKWVWPACWTSRRWECKMQTVCYWWLSSTSSHWYAWQRQWYPRWRHRTTAAWRLWWSCNWRLGPRRAGRSTASRRSRPCSFWRRGGRCWPWSAAWRSPATSGPPWSWGRKRQLRPRACPRPARSRVCPRWGRRPWPYSSCVRWCEVWCGFGPRRCRCPTSTAWIRSRRLEWRWTSWSLLTRQSTLHFCLWFLGCFTSWLT